MSTYYERRNEFMATVHEHYAPIVEPDLNELAEDLAAFREDLVLYEENHLDNLAAWARVKIAELERRLEGVQPLSAGLTQGE